KKNKPISPKKLVASICAMPEKKLSNSIFFLFAVGKNSAFAPYSPMRLGVANETVSEAKLCFKAVEKFIFSITETKVCHFKISKNQFAAAKNEKSKNKNPETLALAKIVSINSAKFSDGL